MIIEFTIENFRSIKEEVTFSFVSSSDKLLPNNLINSDLLSINDNLLKTAVIYGANASGKSNVIMAFSSLQSMVLDSLKNQPDDPLPYYPFKLDSTYLSKPTTFRLVFIHNNVKYVYGLSFTQDKIVNEYLHHYPLKRKAIIFERYEGQEPVFIKNPNVQAKIYDRTLDNVLYLSNSAQQNYQKTLEVFKWFKHEFNVFDNTSSIQFAGSTVDLLDETIESRDEIIKKLIVADLGINNVSTQDVELNIERFPEHIPRRKGGVYIKQEDGKFSITDIKVTHYIVDEDNVPTSVDFDFYDDESEGTKRYFYLMGPILDSLRHGKTLIIDEMDLKLHPLLTRYLVELFHNPDENTQGAQLLFTTHNVNLLELDLFRRDQIWFTEKNPSSGSTDLYSLLEFKPRNDKNIQKGYMSGRYGGVPFINY